MRILHTSDWHLGKRLFKLDRTEEHQSFLNWLLSTLIEKDIDLLIVAGDVFDTPTPPHQALEMFYEFLARVSKETKTETLIIAGNHDSGLLLEAPRKLLSTHRIKVWGKLSENPEDHWIKFDKGSERLDICALPFFRSYEILTSGEGDALTALNKYLAHDRSAPKLLILHHLAGIFTAAGSEQVISLSGVDSIPVEFLKEFNYVALGHIHKPQRVADNCYYSGSPIPLRFSETHPKSVVVIDVKKGELIPEILPIPLSRQFFILKTTDTDWRQKIESLRINSPLMPMVEIQMTLSSPKMGLVEEIKTALENKGAELLSYLPTYSNEEKTEKKHHRLFELSPLELFEEFYSTKYPDAPELPPDVKEDFKILLEKVQHASSQA